MGKPSFEIKDKQLRKYTILAETGLSNFVVMVSSAWTSREDKKKNRLVSLLLFMF